MASGTVSFKTLTYLYWDGNTFRYSVHSVKRVSYEHLHSFLFFYCVHRDPNQSVDVEVILIIQLNLDLLVQLLTLFILGCVFTRVPHIKL